MKLNCPKCGGPTEVLFNIRTCSTCDHLKIVDESPKANCIRVEEILGMISLAYEPFPTSGFPFCIKGYSVRSDWYSYPLNFLIRVNEWLRGNEDTELEILLGRQSKFDKYIWHGYNLNKSISFKNILNCWQMLYCKSTKKYLVL